MINEQVYSQHPDSMPDEQAPTTYLDAQGRDWQYWPPAASDQMWSEATCNQVGCDHPAAFVGLADVTGNRTLCYDSAAAWCYWCMPREVMTPEARSMAMHAEWARRQTVEDCITVIRRVRDEAGDNDTVDAVLTRLIADLRSATESREQLLARSILTPEYLDGRPHSPGQVYAVRPVGDGDAVPGDAAALYLRTNIVS
jgi:hypothetical protein